MCVLQPPVEKRPWSEVLLATREGQPCIQIEMLNASLLGSEDCLFLNVFTPHVMSRAPFDLASQPFDSSKSLTVDLSVVSFRRTSPTPRPALPTLPRPSSSGSTEAASRRATPTPSCTGRITLWRGTSSSCRPTTASEP